MNNTYKANEEIYISVDVEADGKIPSINSMMALGATVAGWRTRDGQIIDADPSLPENRFYAQLKPISQEWTADAIAVAVLDGWNNATDDPTGALKHQWLVENGEDPSVAMERFTAWVVERKEALDAKVPVFVGFPVVYDWMWVYWYMIAFTKDGSPFGHGRAADIKTAFAIKSGNSIVSSIKRRMPKFLHSKLPHTHKAVDDAAEQGQLALNIFRWSGSENPISDNVKQSAQEIRDFLESELSNANEHAEIYSARARELALELREKALKNLAKWQEDRNKK